MKLDLLSFCLRRTPEGARCPGDGQRALGGRRWMLGAGRWVVGTGHWVVGTGRWAPGDGHWAVGDGPWCRAESPLPGLSRPAGAEPGGADASFTSQICPRLALRCRAGPSRRQPLRGGGRPKGGGGETGLGLSSPGENGKQASAAVGGDIFLSPQAKRKKPL